MKYIDLECKRIGSKLRVRILTPGYLNLANCQFPRDIRIECARYRVRATDIKLITARGRWFYSVKKKEEIEVLNQVNLANANTTNQLDSSNLPNLANLQIYEDKDEQECAICLSEQKNTVFYPCGHYHACTKCSNMIKFCPMCMTKIDNRIDRSLID
jgi:hypothetical protein